MQKSDKSIIKKILLSLAGVCVGVLAMWGVYSLTNGGGSDRENPVGLEDSEERRELQESQLTELQEVVYPFGYSTEGWRLVLCAETPVDGSSGYLLRMYDQEGVLLQEFACDVGAEALLFRFDRLYSYYGWHEDLEVFPENAEETGAHGLLFPWDNEAKRFREKPIEIPWYMETGPENAYLVKRMEDPGETLSVYRINVETEEPVELRRWMLTKPEADSGETRGHLRIWDCLEKVTRYDGEVEWNDIGHLENEKYYRDLFLWDLETLWSYTEEPEIPTTRIARDEEGKVNLDRVTYESREELLADCGFLEAEPFYRYYDNFQNLELEFYFDEEEKRGCGFLYSHRFNYQLEKVEQCSGFIFEGVTVEEWEAEDTFSTLTYDGAYAGDSEVLGYREIYAYTDDGKLSSFEAKGIVYWYGEDGGNEEESTLLSMNYVYRNDGTLYRKEYHHHPALFATTLQSQYSDYDELGRLVCRSGYITHGGLVYYYIYEDAGEKPDYCICFDIGMGYTLPTVTVYR